MGSSDGGFGIYINHGGQFVKLDGNKFYVGGFLVPRLDLDEDRFGYLDVVDEIEKLGYVSWKSISYKPTNSNNFVELKNDVDVMDMLSHLGDRCRVVELFVDCGKKLETDLNVELGEEHETEYNEIGIRNSFQNGSDGSDSEEDEDYIPDELSDELSDYTDDGMDDDELGSDCEYIEARRRLRDKTSRGLCDEVLGRETGRECGFSDYEDSDGDIYSSETDEDWEVDKIRKKVERIVYDPKCDHKELKLALRMRFEDGIQCRDAIKENAIEDGRGIHFRRVSKEQMEAYCNPPCKWRCYGSIDKPTGHFLIKVLKQPHTCTTDMRNHQVNSPWIAKKYLNVFRYRPDLTVKELGQDIVRRYNCKVSIWKLYQAKYKAIEMLRGTVDEHYAKLRSYILELKRQDIEGKFELWTGVGAVFKGIYIGFSGLKKGFQEGCRRVIGLDGAHLKTYLGGVLLCAVGNDPNNQMFPIAWAIVEVENQENWSWFLKILTEDLGLSTGAGTTFISDQQKGLLNAVAEYAPMAEHRNCARHVFINWKKSNKEKSLKNLFWKIVRSTYQAEFNHNLDALKAKNVGAYEDFMARDFTKFCKVFINPTSTSDMILNNTSETFNGYILNARGKHCIHMLEEIRTSLMERLHRKAKDLKDYEHSICPEILKKLENIKYFSRYCVPYAASDVLFEVEKFGDRFIVDVKARTCTCRAWDITGIPCIHACAAIHLMRKEASDFCHGAYSVAKYREAYKYGLPPLNGERMWPTAEGFPIIPPAVKKMPGRPKKKRKRNPLEEDPKNPSRLRKTGVRMTCQKCYQIGHNRRSCKNEATARPNSQRGKHGRPRKSEIPAQQSRPSTSAASNAHIHSRLTSSRETMGSGGIVSTRMPADERRVFIPPRPSTSAVASSSRKTKKKFTSTQESCN